MKFSKNVGVEYIIITISHVLHDEDTFYTICEHRLKIRYLTDSKYNKLSMLLSIPSASHSNFKIHKCYRFWISTHLKQYLLLASRIKFELFSLPVKRKRKLQRTINRRSQTLSVLVYK